MSIVDSNANDVGAAFEKLDFFIVQDVFFSHTCQFADVALPASPSLEKEGRSPAPNGASRGSAVAAAATAVLAKIGVERVPSNLVYCRADSHRACVRMGHRDCAWRISLAA
jgi:anaerobic selenocysteine-containing dehydrogenase